MLAEGWSNFYISKKLFINSDSLRTSLSKIYTKLELDGSKDKAIHPRVGAVLTYYRSPKAIMNAFPESFEIQQWEFPDD